jgi:crotonobetaine/carnitine-CoA ligase
MGHRDPADVAVPAVASPVDEDDVKVTATVKEGARLSPEELFSWCVDPLAHVALPRHVEFRRQPPCSPVGRVLERRLGVAPATWDPDAAGSVYEKR